MLDVKPYERVAEPVPAQRVQRYRSTRRLLRNRAAVVSLVSILLLILVAIFAPLLATAPPNQQDLLARFQGPSGAHWLGTDTFGRDIYSRMLYGSRVTLQAAFEAVSIAFLLGVPAGLLAGYLGRSVSIALNAVADAIMSIPGLLLAIVIAGVLGPGLTNAMIAIGVILAPRFFRVARSAGQSIRHETYIEAARATGCSTFRIVWRHVFPNASGPLIVQASFGIGLAIVAEASLSFIGLGVQAPQASWGSMVGEAFPNLSQSTSGLYAPSIAIGLTILMFSLLGDGLRDALGRETGKER